MSIFLLEEKEKENKFKFILKGITKVLRKKLMVYLTRIDGRNHTGQISTYSRGGDINEGTV